MHWNTGTKRTKTDLTRPLLGVVVLALLGEPRLLAVYCAEVDITDPPRAIYVSPLGADTPTCGQSADAPCASIQQGIDRCRQAGPGCGVLVRHGLYTPPAPVELADGISVYGSCVFSGPHRGYRSVVRGRPAIRANRIMTPTMLHGFQIVGTDGVAPGEASIAMTVSTSTRLALSANVIASGKGADGRSGSPAGSGGRGGDGLAALGDAGGFGGPACAESPSTTAGRGGQGADFQQLYSSGCFLACNCENNNYPNSLGRPGQDSGTVKGGSGGDRASSGCHCSGTLNVSSGDGAPGTAGNPGACGRRGGSASHSVGGSFQETTWRPAQSGTGDTGDVGSGGGGGGSGGFAVTLAPTTDYPGRPGGGGGGGGCGGPGGTGGWQGGASIPLVLFQSSLAGSVATNAFVPGPGGRGGAGTTGGSGGLGGSGHDGLAGHQNGPSGSCDGSFPGSGGTGREGGQGGAGAGGAGGNGGPSYAIAFVGSSLVPDGYTGGYAGQPGFGGPKGPGGQNTSSQCGGAAGEDGALGSFARFGDNILAPGEQLSNGQARFSSDGRFHFEMQNDGNIVLYEFATGRVVWALGSNDPNVTGLPQRVVMHNNGELILYVTRSGSEHPRWTSGTGGHPGAYLKIQDDGRLVMYQGQTPVLSIP